MSEAIEIESIHRYQAKPGDTIILTLGGRLGPEQTHRLVDLLKDKWPGNSVVILPVGARVEVVGNGA